MPPRHPIHPLILAIPLIALHVAPPHAQRITTGVRAGVNLADVKTVGEGGDAPLDPSLGGVFGGFVVMPITPWLELQPEALYSRKGARTDNDGIKSTLLLDYLEIPVLARTARGRIYFAAGPTFGVRLRAKTRTKFSGATEEIDVSDDVEILDAGVAFGGGVSVGSLIVDGRFTLGLRDIDKDRSDDLKLTNRVMSITVAFNF